MKDSNMFNNSGKFYIAAGDHAGLVADYLDSQGYQHGYGTMPCQRRAPSNMPFITIDNENKMYSGSKGMAIDKPWQKLSQREAQHMRNEIKKGNNMSDIDVYNKFYSTFGKAGWIKVIDGFGVYGGRFDAATRFDQLTGRAREVVLTRMRNALNHEMSVANHRKVMSKDEARIERVWVAATGREYPISRMDDNHLHNTILLIDRKVADGEWVIGANTDLPELFEEMEAERERRKMPLPLIPIKSLEWRKSNVKK
jgi:hypothetical protein